MAVVPEYGGPSVAPAVGAGIQGASYQAMQAPASADPGKMLLEGATKYAGIQAKILEETDEAIAVEADTQASKFFTDLSAEFSRLKGKDALQADQDGVSPVENIMKRAGEFGQGLLSGKTKSQSLKIKTKLAARMNALYGQSMQHAVTENHNYLVTTYQNSLKEAQQVAFTYSNNPDFVAGAIEQARTAATKLSELAGIDSKQALFDAEAAIHGQVAEGLLNSANENPTMYAACNEYVKRHRKQMNGKDVVSFSSRAVNGQKDYAATQASIALHEQFRFKPTTIELAVNKTFTEQENAYQQYEAYMKGEAGGDGAKAIAMLTLSPEKVSQAVEKAKKDGNEALWGNYLSEDDRKAVEARKDSLAKHQDEREVFDASGRKVANIFDSQYAESAFVMPDEKAIRAAAEKDVYGHDPKWVDAVVNSTMARFRRDKESYVARHTEALDAVCSAYAADATPDEKYKSQLTVQELLEAQRFRAKVIAGDTTGDAELAARYKANPEEFGKLSRAQMRNALRACPRGTRRSLLEIWFKERKKQGMVAENWDNVAKGIVVTGPTAATEQFVLRVLRNRDKQFEKLPEDQQALVSQRVAMVFSERSGLNIGEDTKDKNAAADALMDMYNKTFQPSYMWFPGDRKSILLLKEGDMTAELKGTARDLAAQLYNKKNPSNGERVEAVIRLITQRSLGDGNKTDYTRLIPIGGRSSVEKYLRDTGINADRLNKGLKAINGDALNAAVKKAMSDNQYVLATWAMMQLGYNGGVPNAVRE